MSERLIADITVGKRHRKDMGDIAGLAASIERNDLLHPVVITPQGKLIAGERRLRAYKLLGRKRVPVRVVNIDSITRGELAENVERKAFLPSEIEAIRRSLEPAEKAKAKARMKAGTPAKVSLGARGRVVDKIGAFAGISGRQVEKIAAVCAAAEADPGRFGKLVEQMDKTGKVDAIHKRLRVARTRDDYQARRDQGGKVEDLAKLAANGFRAAVILIDFPYRYESWSEAGTDRAAANHYDTMSIKQILAFAEKYVRPLRAKNCALFMWATWPFMPEWNEIIEACGFKYSTCGFDWNKTNKSGVGWHRGSGPTIVGNSEPCLLGLHGSPLRLANDVEQIIDAPVREHSRKPDETYERIERLYAGPYLELFARQKRDSWRFWGGELEFE